MLARLSTQYAEDNQSEHTFRAKRTRYGFTLVSIYTLHCVPYPHSIGYFICKTKPFASLLWGWCLNSDRKKNIFGFRGCKYWFSWVKKIWYFVKCIKRASSHRSFYNFVYLPSHKYFAHKILKCRQTASSYFL